MPAYTQKYICVFLHLQENQQKKKAVLSKAKPPGKGCWVYPAVLSKVMFSYHCKGVKREAKSN